MRAVAVVLVALLAPAARAHDMWIVPEPARPGMGEVVKLHLRLGHAGESETVRRDARRIVRFTATGPGGEVEVAGLDGADPAGLFRPDAPGLWAVAFVSTQAYSELEAAKFEAYLVEEGLETIRDLRREKGLGETPGRELYSRSLKCLVRVGDGDGPPDRRLGLPLELTIESGAPAAGAEVVLRLLFEGEPVADALVDLRRIDGDATPRGPRTGGDGRLRARLEPGRWLAAAVHMRPSSSERAEWESVFTTLVFEVPPPGETQLERERYSSRK